MSCAASDRELDNLRAAFEERARTREFLERRLGPRKLEPNLTQRLADTRNAGYRRRAARAEAGARLARRNQRRDGASEAALAALRAEHQAADARCAREERLDRKLKDDLSDLVREAAVIRGRLADLSGERAELESASGRELRAEMPEL